MSPGTACFLQATPRLRIRVQDNRNWQELLRIFESTNASAARPAKQNARPPRNSRRQPQGPTAHRPSGDHSVPRKPTPCATPFRDVARPWRIAKMHHSVFDSLLLSLRFARRASCPRLPPLNRWTVGGTTVPATTPTCAGRELAWSLQQGEKRRRPPERKVEVETFRSSRGRASAEARARAAMARSCKLEPERPRAGGRQAGGRCRRTLSVGRSGGRARRCLLGGGGGRGCDLRRSGS